MTGFNLPDGCNNSDLPECEEDDGACTQCGSITGLKFPRGLPAYCEDCGWPDDNFGED